MVNDFVLKQFWDLVNKWSHLPCQFLWYFSLIYMFVNCALNEENNPQMNSDESLVAALIFSYQSWNKCLPTIDKLITIIHSPIDWNQLTQPVNRMFTFSTMTWTSWGIWKHHCPCVKVMCVTHESNYRTVMIQLMKHLWTVASFFL